MNANQYRQRFYPKSYASQKSIDGTPLLKSMVVQRLPSRGMILDVGAGAGSVIYPYEHSGVSLIGIDLSENIASNPHLDFCQQASAENMPFEDGGFDLVFSDFVIEHLANPRKVINEVGRVLKPGGRFIFRTVNKLHYVALTSLALPEPVRDKILDSGLIVRIRSRSLARR